MESAMWNDGAERRSTAGHEKALKEPATGPDISLEALDPVTSSHSHMDSVPTALLLTAIHGADHFAAALSDRAGVVLELVRSRRAALASLRRYQFDVVLVDTALPLGEVTPTQILWQNMGSALPIEVDLRALGAPGTARLLRSMLQRRQQIESLVRESVTRTLAEEMRGPITGLLLQSDLMLSDRQLNPETAAKVREMRALADDLRVRLRPVC